MRSRSLSLGLLLVAGCQADVSYPGDESASAAASPTDLDLIGFVAPDHPAHFRLKTDQRVHGYLFHADAGAVVTLRAQSAGAPVRTRVLARGEDGKYTVEVPTSATTPDGQTAPRPIETADTYVAEIAVDADASATFEPFFYDLGLSCAGAACAAPPQGRYGIEVLWYRTAAEFRAGARQAYRFATLQLDAALAARPRSAGRWGVISDIDETALDNSNFQRERALLGLKYSSGAWTEWVFRRAAPAVPGAVEYFQHVRERGGVVAFVSNRNAEECPATEENLRAAGIQPDVVLCRTDMTDPGKQKELRFGQVTSGTARAGVPAIEPLLFTGDNIEDFPDLDQASVAAHPEQLDDFGSRYFMLPNPMYGSFEKNTPN